MKLHLTPKWIRQEKESLSTVQRGLFRSKMKRVSTAVYKANSPVHYHFIIMFFFLSFPILNRRVDYAESESQQICSWQTVRILYLFNSLVMRSSSSFNMSRYPAAGNCFQKTRYPAVRNFDQFSRNSSFNSSKNIIYLFRNLKRL